MGVPVEVHFILDVFGHDQEYLGGTVPDEQPFDRFVQPIFYSMKIGQVRIVVYQHQLTDIRIQIFQMTADDQRSLFVQTGHQDDQVDMPFGQNLQGFCFAGDRSKTGGGIQVDL